MFLLTNPGVLSDAGQPEDEAVLLLRGDGGELRLVGAGASEAGGGPGHLGQDGLQWMIHRLEENTLSVNNL